jgi:hypothetical protein
MLRAAVRAPWLAAAALALAVAACGGGEGGGTPDGGYDCAIEDRDDDFVAGLEKTGEDGALRFRLMQSTPAPPSRGNNAWTIEVVDAAGAPVPGAALTVKPFMPDHQHGTGIKAKLTEQSDGLYLAEPVNLWMPGLWEVTIEARAAAATDRVVYRFCIAA